MDKEYVVTLHKKEDLEQFYNEMQLTNFPLVKKRPLSRNTHYMMTEEQAERLRQDPRVWDVQLFDEINNIRPQSINREPWIVVGQFWKNGPVSSGINGNDKQWGHLHVAGDEAQKRKNQWGDGTYTPIVEFVTDAANVFDNGRNVDVVIVDDPVSYDSEEWNSPTSLQSRFVQYQWFNELNTLVNSIDDDAETEPTGTITYGTNATTPQFHGIHVTGTACGQHYGWAREANIYNIAVTDTWPSGQIVGAYLIYDYLRAFHRNKSVNPATGKKNPTITNHSYGGIRYLNSAETFLDINDISQVVYRNTSYSSSSPGPSGWTEAGLKTDFGINFNLDLYPSYSAGIAADVQDAIDEGIVIIGAAGNDNLLIDVPGGDDWDNRIVLNNGYGTIYYNRGAWPNTPDTDVISVGALSDHSEFRRSTYSNYGPGVTVFAPGDGILSSFGNTGFADNKYSAGNYFQQIQGTSMASPQVCGVVACLASTKDRINNADVLGYLDATSDKNNMTFDVAGGTFNDSSCQKGSPNSMLVATNPRQTIGYIQEQKASRSTSQLTYPRVSVLRAPISGPQPQTYILSVRNNSSSDWRWVSGTDRSGVTFNDTATYDDWTLEFNAGDTIRITNNAGSIHPFYIKTSPTTGTGNQVTTGTITGNGASLGNTVIWDTTGVTPGTYYYICSNHSNMLGSIVIS